MNSLEIRALENVNVVGEMKIAGYALKFNTLSENLGGFKETILPTALNNTDLSDVRLFFDHDSSKILGRTKSDTLKLEIDEVGLKIECVLPNTSIARDLYESIKRGDINQMSFGFFIRKGGDKFIKQKDGSVVRELHDIEKIHEVSIVSIPAYEDTDVSVATRGYVESLKKHEKQKLLLELELTKLQMEL